jgi:ferredoxin
MDVTMYTVKIDIDKCQGCGDCVDSCPIQILEIAEENGKKFVTFSDDPDECVGCYACEESCPEEAITMVTLEETGLLVQMLA